MTQPSHTCASVQFSHSVMSDSLWPHGLQHARFPCPSPIPRACSNSWPLSWWCHPTISSSVLHFLPSIFSSIKVFSNEFFISGGQRIEASASASVLPMNIQDWFPLGLTGLISLQIAQIAKHLLDHWKGKRVPEKHLLLLYWLNQSLWLYGSQQNVENSERDGNTRPLDLPLRNLYAG